MFYKVVIETGHRRGESNFQIIRYLKAHNTVHLFDMLEEEPGIASGQSGYAITMVKAIGRGEYEEGRSEEKKNPVNLRAHVRFKIKKKCNISFKSASDVRGKTDNISAGGLGINYVGTLFQAGAIVQITIDELEIFEKAAQVVWSFSKGHKIYAGLRWV